MAIKQLKENVKFLQFYISAIWQGASLTRYMLITTLFQVLPEGHQLLRDEVGSQNLGECISEIRAGNIPILSTTCYPTVPLSPKVH